MILRFINESNAFIWLLLINFICDIVGGVQPNDISTIDLKDEGKLGGILLDVGNIFSFKDISSDKQTTFSTSPSSLKSFLFLLNQKILISKPLKREIFCQSSIYCDLYIDLKYTNLTGYVENKKVKIQFLNTNKKPPLFPITIIKKQFKSLPKEDLTIDLPLATDPDENTLITYSLIPRNTPFMLSKRTDSDGKIVDLKLKLVKKLDEKTERTIEFLVVATNNHKPLLSSELKISIQILEENADQPKFMKDIYNGEVKTDDEVGTVILQIMMNHLENENVRYYFPVKTQTLYGQFFEIDEESGVITLKSTLKSKSHLESQIKFLIMADVGMNPIPSSTTVTINITNSNTHEPNIRIESPYQGSDLRNLIIEENNKENIQLARIFVSDEDMGEGGMVDCEVKSQTFEMIRSNDQEFLLIVKKILDHESQGLYKLDISCRDFGNPPLSNILKLTIFVTDLDDNPPVFDKPVYLVELAENSLVGTRILKLDVTDQDSHFENKKVTFFIEPHFEHLFSIDQSSCMVYTRSNFNREEVAEYNFHIFAKSGASKIDLSTHNKNSSSLEHITKTLVKVTITDVDDEVAKFTKPWFKFEVQENQLSGAFVGRVIAVDADLPPNNKFTYSLTPQYKIRNLEINEESKQNYLNTKKLPFYVDKNSGEIRTTTPLDRETKSKYDFEVYAGNESTTVYVEVKDLNDNIPIFEDSLKNSCLQPKIISVQGNLTLSRHLSKITASDLDKNDDITYSIIAGNDFNQFGINEKSGEIFWNSYLSGLKNSQGCKSQLKVKAQDYFHSSETACLEIVFEECLSQLLQQQKLQEQTKKHTTNFMFPFSDLYFLIIVIVLVCCVATVIILTTAICITKNKTKKLKRKSRMMMIQDHDLQSSQFLKSNMQLSRSDADTLLVLNRSQDNESSDQLTGILVSIKSVEQLQRLQLRSLAPSRDSLMSTSTSVCKERDGDSGYADVASPV